MPAQPQNLLKINRPYFQLQSENELGMINADDPPNTEELDDEVFEREEDPNEDIHEEKDDVQDHNEEVVENDKDDYSQEQYEEDDHESDNEVMIETDENIYEEDIIDNEDEHLEPVANNNEETVVLEHNEVTMETNDEKHEIRDVDDDDDDDDDQDSDLNM